MNLEQICAKYGFEIEKNANKKLRDSKKTENLLTRSLGVLQEQGIYAFFLYLASRNESEAPSEVSKESQNLLKDEKVGLLTRDEEDICRKMREESGLLNNINALLLAFNLLEKSLIYARYHAKSLGSSSAAISELGGE